jgi:hypothetical protein
MTTDNNDDQKVPFGAFWLVSQLRVKQFKYLTGIGSG